MWNQNEAYFDYVEIRRRVERRLPSGQVMLAHTGLFVLGLLGLIAVFGQPLSSSGTIMFNLMMGLWSGVLLLHGLWSYRNGASQTDRRLAVVKAEVEERLDAGDTELLANERQAFRIQSLLDEDVRLRAGWVPAMVFAQFMNCFIWGVSLVSGARGGSVWPVLIILSFAYFPATYAINKVRRVNRDRKLSQMLTTRPVAAARAVKQKRSFDAELERYTRLSDDGELVDIPDDWATYDRHKRG